MSERSDWYRIGHTTFPVDRTGCTVILFDELVPAVVDVRGGAPGSRETELLQPGRQLGRVDALVLTGGSAFGLAAADGVVTWLAERGRGFPTSAGPVPIVPASVIFDLATGVPRRVTSEDGYAAAESATRDSTASGRIGAGTGATVAKLGGSATDAGLGMATVESGAVSLTAIVVLNAVGDIRGPESGKWFARAKDPEGLGRDGRQLALAARVRQRQLENTTIGVILVPGHANRDALVRCCVSAHAALARCVVPAHTLFDGDTFYATAQRDGPTTPAMNLALSAAAEVAVERAIISIFDAP